MCISSALTTALCTGDHNHPRTVEDEAEITGLGSEQARISCSPLPDHIKSGLLTLSVLPSGMVRRDKHARHRNDWGSGQTERLLEPS